MDSSRPNGHATLLPKPKMNVTLRPLLGQMPVECVITDKEVRTVDVFAGLVFDRQTGKMLRRPAYILSDEYEIDASSVRVWRRHHYENGAHFSQAG